MIAKNSFLQLIDIIRVNFFRKKDASRILMTVFNTQV